MVKKMPVVVKSMLEPERDHQVLLREAEVQFQRLFESVPIGLFECAADGQFLSANPAVVQMLDFSGPEELSQNNLFDLFLDPIDRQQFQDMLESDGLAKGYEAKFRKKNGLPLWVRVNVQSIQNHGDRMFYYEGSLEEITERKQAEKVSKQQLEAMEASLDGLAILNQQGKYIYLNKAHAKIYGYEHPEELLGKSWKALYDGKELKRFEQHIMPGFFKKGHWRGEAIGKKKDGTTFPQEISLTAIKTGGLICVVRDISERKKAEEALQQSEKRYHSLFEFANDAIFLMDKEKFIECNAVTLSMFGCDRVEDIIGHPPWEFSPSQQPGGISSRKKALKYINAALKGKPQRFYWKHTRKNGTPFDAEVSLNRLKIGGKILIQAMVRDISEHIQAEEALRESEERYRTIVENSHDAIIIIDDAFRFTYVNKEFCRITGYSSSEIMGHDFRELVSDESIDIVTDHYRRRQQGEKVPTRYEFSLVTKAGEERYVEIAAATRKDSKGKVKTIGQLLDITERKRAEDALRESEEKYRQLIQHSNDAIYLLYKGKFEIINDKFQEMFGFTIEEVNRPEFNFMDLVAPRSKPLIQERARRLANGEKLNLRYEFTALSKEGKEIEVETSVSYINYKDGVATQGIIRDITERQLLEQQLFQAQKMEAIGKLAGGVAHDFNNLLTVINGTSELLLLQLKPGDPVYEDVQEIKNAGARAAKFTEQLLAFSRRQVLQPKILNINKIVTETRKMLQRLIGEDIDLVATLDPHLGNVEADLAQIEQVIMNLAINARDAMPQGGKLTLETANIDIDEAYTEKHLNIQPGPFVMLAVSDTGMGMDFETQSHIFEPFFTTKEKGRGTGLGLSTVYGIIKQHNGYIWVYSEPGKGTTFKIYLPRVDGGLDSVNASHSHSESLTGSETILLVEDDERVRNLAHRVLREKGYTILEAANGSEALKVSGHYNGPIHLMVTDVVMPVMGGPELVKRMAPIRPGMKVIYISGYTDNAFIHQGGWDAQILFLQKPFSPVHLLQEVRKVLNKDGLKH